MEDQSKTPSNLHSKPTNFFVSIFFVFLIPVWKTTAACPSVALLINFHWTEYVTEFMLVQWAQVHLITKELVQVMKSTTVDDIPHCAVSILCHTFRGRRWQKFRLTMNNENLLCINRRIGTFHSARTDLFFVPTPWWFYC